MSAFSSVLLLGVQSALPLLPPRRKVEQTSLKNDFQDNRQFIVLDDPNAQSACLDGSPYAFYVWPGNSTEWSISIHGGGWCLTEQLCDARADTALGSSRGYNITGPFGPPPNHPPAGAGPAEYDCEGLDSNCTRVFMPYCDGSCFTSQRKAPWPVPNTNRSLHFRGLANMDSTLDMLESRFGLASAKRVVLQGGSAGGLSTYLHLDHVADRIRSMQTNSADKPHIAQDTPHPEGLPSSSVSSSTTSAPQALVVGRPVAGFFIDEQNFDPSQPSYADDIKYGVNMFNSTPPLSTACKAAHVNETWKCFMAPYAAPFVKEPIFAVQSRFDEFQLSCLLGLPCFHHQSYEPPYAPSNCSSTELKAITTFGGELLSQLQPFLNANPANGLWLVSCIQHDVVCDMYNITEQDAFASWLARGSLGKDIGYRWIDDCGVNGTTPCNTGSHCSPPHF